MESALLSSHSHGARFNARPLDAIRGRDLLAMAAFGGATFVFIWWLRLWLGVVLVGGCALTGACR